MAASKSLSALALRLVAAAGRVPYLPFRATNVMLNGLRQAVTSTPSAIGLPYEDVTFASEDGVPLEGWFLPQAGSRTSPAPTVVFVHGWPWNRLGNRAGKMPFPDRDVNFLLPAKALHGAGFQVLMFDLRNHGESGSALPVTNGLHESRDLVGAVRMLRARADVDGERLGVLGTSMGGNVAVYGIPRCQPIRAATIVQPTHLRVFMANFASKEFGPLGRAIARNSDLLFDWVGAPRPAAHDLVASARQLGDTVVRFVQGSGDPWGTLADVEAIAAATPKREALVVHPSADRYGGYGYVESCTDELIGFFRAHLGAPSR